MQILLNWLLAALAIIVTSYILPGVKLEGFMPAFILAVVLGLLNSFLKPLIIILTLPINILTLGLFTLVINASLVLLAAKIVPGFDIQNFWWAILFSLVLFIVNFGLGRK